MAARFETTRWSLVLAAREQHNPEAQGALASLCETYWYPLYAFVRRQGNNPDEARDLTQSYFLALLEKDYLADVKPEAGRFRSFLLASMKHFLSKERDRARAKKRGDGVAVLDLESAEERFREDAAGQENAETLFERRWALAVLDRAMERLAGEFEVAGKQQQFRRLRSCLTGETPRTPYSELAAELGMTEGAVKVAVHRSRRRLGQLLRAEVAQTLANPEDMDEEVRFLLHCLRP